MHAATTRAEDPIGTCFISYALLAHAAQAATEDGTVRCGTVWCDTVWILYGTAWQVRYDTVWCGMVRYGMVQCGMVWYCTEHISGCIAALTRTN